MTLSNFFIKNITYINVDRRIQFAELGSTAIDGDVGTVFAEFGNNFGQHFRSLGDGEINTGLIDLDGDYSVDGEPCMIMPQVYFQLYFFNIFLN